MSRPPSLSDILKQVDSCDTLTEQEKIEVKFASFKKYSQWYSKDYEQYEELLDKLKKAKRKKNHTTKEIGDALENIVDFIFEKSFFYKVFPNKRTSTHEIDQFVILSQKGKQVLHELGITREVLIAQQDYFLCECKNYKESIAATWVGKFNTLLDVTGDCEVGIIFSYKGLTGEENNWYDAHGLSKVIYRLSPEGKKRYILDFSIKDFESLRNPTNDIFSIVEAKKKALIANVKSPKLYEETHEGYEQVKLIYESIEQ